MGPQSREDAGRAQKLRSKELLIPPIPTSREPEYGISLVTTCGPRTQHLPKLTEPKVLNDPWGPQGSHEAVSRSIAPYFCLEVPGLL